LSAPARRILAVDDEPVSRTILVRALSAAGYEVLPASGGAEALALFEREAPAVVVTDWSMPGVDGLEVCRRCRAERPGGYVYIVVMTAERREKADIVAALDAGADDFLTKPFDGAELRARMRTAWRVIDLEAELAARLRALEEHQARLVEAERLAAVGAAGLTMKHEINNPLTGIVGHCDLHLMDREKLDADVARSFETIRGLARTIAASVARLETATAVRTKEYLPGSTMLDLGTGKP
jgi:DNA-binding response OmpR family regulator